MMRPREVRPLCCAVMADDGMRSGSSSGGAFPVFARQILADGGAVCGAAFDARFVCRYEVVEDIPSLARLQGSKYVKAAMTAEFLAHVRRILESGRNVLFVGTPCQVAAVKRIFADYHDWLLTVDLICAGCPDQKLFNRYLDDNWGRDNVASFEFRCKRRGWRHHHYLLRIRLKDGREILREKGEDEYMTAMSSGLGLQEGCLNCPFCTMDRPGDLTIGDFWQVPKEMDDGKGTSAVLANTERGRRFFESVRAAFARVAEYPPNLLQERQSRLRTPPTPAVGRKVFWESIAAGLSVKEALAKGLTDIGRNVAVLNFHWETVNFGAVLTAYALNRAIRDMGFEVRNIDFRTDLPRVLKKPENPRFDEFRRRNIPMTPPYRDAAALNRLNALFDTFVVGSDQVWNPNIAGWYKDAYFLAFANPKKRMIAAAASFGIDPVNAYGKRGLRRLLQPFDAIGVREQSAVERLAEAGIKARLCIDPVFLLSKDQWLSLAARSKAARGGSHVVWYAVNQYGRDGLSQYFAANDHELSGRLVHLDASFRIEDWVAAIADASLVLTDSFHGVCFAILFERPFAVVVSTSPKSRRMRDFLAMLGLSGRIFENASAMPSVGELSRAVDFSSARVRISEMARDFSAFLKESLARPVSTDPKGVALRKAAARYLLWSEAVAFALRWCRNALMLVKLTAKFALGCDFSREAEWLWGRGVIMSGRKRAIRRLLGALRRLCQWKA